MWRSKAPADLISYEVQIDMKFNERFSVDVVKTIARMDWQKSLNGLDKALVDSESFWALVDSRGF